ncbi:MAG TPA: acyltransferase [Franconibacter pulveris]|nr:acyltransferase [Franconibacter pulveris]
MHKNNCFDIIRHLAALMVIFSHHHAFMLVHEDLFRGFLSWGGVCVAVFFSISGFLVTQSAQRSPDYISFMTKRVKRIFPALAVCSFLMIYLLAPFYQQNAIAFMKSSDAFESFIKIIMLLPVNVSDVFAGYKYAGSINGSLWTLTLEFTCYIVVGFLLYLNNNWKTPATLLSLLIAINIFAGAGTKNIVWYSMNFGWLIMFGICFALGSLLSMTIEQWNKPQIKVFMSLISVAILFLLKGSPEILTLGYIAITLLTICIGMSFKDIIVKGRFDISYGLYIYAWPVQQIIANKTSLGFYPGIIASMVCTAILAYLSWHLIEKRFLRRKSSAVSVATFEAVQ